MYPQRPPEFPTIPGVPQNQMQGGTQISQQYTPGGTQTNTLGGSYGVAQTPDLSKYFNAMLKYKMAMEAQQRQGAMPQMQAPRPSYGGTMQEATGMNQNDSLMKTMEQEAKMAQLQAMISPPPVKMQGQGPQQIPGWGMADPHMMSGAQRQAYLPKESSITAGGESTPGMGSATSTAGEDMSIAARYEAARRQAQQREADAYAGIVSPERG